MTFVVNQIILCMFNYLNSKVDAYKVLDNKAIAHGINFGMYAVLNAALVYLWHHDFAPSLLFCVSAFFNRQISFDIPLNLERKLPWYYQSTANPPKALMDKIERFVFGVDYSGKKIVFWYAILYALTVIVYYL